jgi:hypothetical protein
MELWTERYELQMLSRAKQSFQGCGGMCGVFGVAGGLWRERIGALVKLGDFSEIVVEF